MVYVIYVQLIAHVINQDAFHVKNKQWEVIKHVNVYILINKLMAYAPSVSLHIFMMMVNVIVLVRYIRNYFILIQMKKFVNFVHKTVNAIQLLDVILAINYIRLLSNWLRIHINAVVLHKNYWCFGKLRTHNITALVSNFQSMIKSLKNVYA